MFKPITISFDFLQIPYLVMLAERRNCTKLTHTNRKYDNNRNDFCVSYNGILGEAGVAKLIGAKVDKTVSLSGDDKISDLLMNDIKIQVKMNLSKGNNIFLYFNEKELFKADIAVLTTIKSACEVDIEGWITREDYLNKAESMNFGKGNRWGVNKKDLQDPNKLAQYLEVRELV
jgi:hypothetical protein